jgi:hypothetical protein
MSREPPTRRQIPGVDGRFSAAGFGTSGKLASSASASTNHIAA